MTEDTFSTSETTNNCNCNLQNTKKNACNCCDKCTGEAGCNCGCANCKCNLQDIKKNTCNCCDQCTGEAECTCGCANCKCNDSCCNSNTARKKSCCQKITNVLGILGFLISLILLIIVLFFHHSKKSTSSIAELAIQKANGSPVSVAFVNNDSVLQNYDLVKKLSEDLKAKYKRLEGEVNARQSAFEKDANYFQEQVQKKSLSEGSSQEIYQKLMQEQQAINELRQRYTTDMAQSEMEMNVALLDSVMNFVKRYNAKYHYDYILGFTKGGNILYANDTLNITKDVIRELNDEYKRKLGK